MSVASSHRVPVTLVTGFLGAGKTTLMRHILQNVQGHRVAVVVQAGGPLGNGGEFLRKYGMEGCGDEESIELPNGCLCSTVRDDFLPALESLLNRTDPPEHVVIETSGLALPRSLLRAFGAPTVRNRVTVDGVVTVIDAFAVASGRFEDKSASEDGMSTAGVPSAHENPIATIFEDQLSAADLIVLNKTDLLDKAGIDAVEKAIKRAAPPSARILRTTEGKVDPAVLLGVGAEAKADLGNAPSVVGVENPVFGHDDFESFVIKVPEQLSVEGFLTLLQNVARKYDVLRTKGYAAVRGQSQRLAVQGGGTRFRHEFDRSLAAGADRMGRIVMIGQKGLKETALRSALSEAG
ncbi:cobalamin biosynthesis protein CobW [Acetobacter senegalensis]|uniref:cobalamin biosynthesis protein CobW n=1 Tax=Acetobacter senegalensis TaxID=446692 RepID=UPI00128CDF9B|nr:cobalamin biosynthesis protein CobW [Acetobacter senegalensis]MPQ72737.1 cobalamin biosynthesis protein CobW [Acetobacter senegalensis]